LWKIIPVEKYRTSTGENIDQNEPRVQKPPVFSGEKEELLVVWYKCYAYSIKVKITYKMY
jgi:hypothetical protein